MTTATLTELKSALREKVERLDRATAAIKVEEGGTFASQELADDFRKTLAEAQEIRGTIAGIESTAELKTFLDAPAGASSAALLDQAAAAGLWVPRQAKSLGERFIASDQFKAFRAKGGSTMDQAWVLEGEDFTDGGTIFGYGQKDVYTASAPVQQTRGFGRTQFDPMVPREYRRARVRDLFPVANTDANLIDYFRVIGFGADRLDLSSAARTVAERTAADGVSPGNAVFGLKPHSSLTFESAQAPVRLIAHYEVAHRNVLQDEPQLQATINNELLYGLRLEEDRQILQGDGTGENLLGILNTPGIQGYTQADLDAGAGVTPEPKSDAVRRAMTKAILAYYEPTGVVLHPYDWEDIELQKATGDGQYMIATNVAVGAEQRLWRSPVVDTPAIPEGTFLTGAFGLGAQLYDRQQGNIRIAEQHADFFIRNAVAILAEERLALAVKRPESFVKGTFIA